MLYAYPLIGYGYFLVRYYNHEKDVVVLENFSDYQCQLMEI